MKNNILLKVNEKDNVAVIINSSGAAYGTILYDDIKAIEDIPMGHKVALQDIATNAPIIRYGETIGYAKKDIKQGSWIDESKVTLPIVTSLSGLDITIKKVKQTKPINGRTFLGYKNSDGSVGTKNMLGIVTCVQCVEGVLNIAVEKITKELLPKYKNIDGIVPINHNYGCGVAIDAKEAEIPIRTLKNLAKNPNFGGEVMVVSLGCEKLLADRLFANQEVKNLVVLQEEAGFDAMIDKIYSTAEEILKRLNNKSREKCPVSELVVGTQCGGSDALSGVTANPAVGYMADLLVRAGATVLFSEVTEVRDGIHLLTPRAASKKVGERLIQEMKWYDDYLATAGVDRDANPTPGNKAGGLANIVEKALGSIAKSGTSTIVDVLSPGERVRKKGLIFAATPASDFVCGTCQLASGINIQVFTTGRGTTYGLAMAPVIKVSTSTGLKERWGDLIDIDAGRVATGKASIEQIGEELFELLIDVASGKKKAGADKYGIKNALCLFNPAPVT